MRKILIAVVACAIIPSVSMANDNVGGCGWGSKLFNGQKGVFPQILAVTTNGTSGNQTFGISSGTSGCTQDGVVKTNWKTAAYIDGNMNRLALDISRGQGEGLDNLAALIGVSSSDRAHFNSALQSNFARLFPDTEVSSTQVMASLRSVLAEDSVLAGYAAAV